VDRLAAAGSPKMASVSPRDMEETPSTRRLMPLGGTERVLQVLDFEQCIYRSGHSRIERITQAVAEQAAARTGPTGTRRGKEHDVWLYLHSAAFGMMLPQDGMVGGCRRR